MKSSGSYYNIINVATGLYLAVKHTFFIQNINDDSDFNKFNISLGGEDLYLIEGKKQTENNISLYASLRNDEIRTAVEVTFLDIRNNETSHYIGQLFYFVKTDNVENPDFTQDKANEMIDTYIKKYYIDITQSSGNKIKGFDGNFMTKALFIEMFLDGYETLSNNNYKSIYGTSYQDKMIIFL